MTSYYDRLNAARSWVEGDSRRIGAINAQLIVDTPVTIQGLETLNHAKGLSKPLLQYLTRLKARQELLKQLPLDSEGSCRHIDEIDEQLTESLSEVIEVLESGADGLLSNHLKRLKEKQQLLEQLRADQAHLLELEGE